MSTIKMILLPFLVLFCFGCQFCLYESEVWIRPVPQTQVATADDVQPAGLGSVAAVFYKIPPEFISMIREIFAGSSQERREAIAANGAKTNNIGVEYKTTRKWFHFDTRKAPYGQSEQQNK